MRKAVWMLLILSFAFTAHANSTRDRLPDGQGPSQAVISGATVTVKSAGPASPRPQKPTRAGHTCSQTCRRQL